MRIDLDEENYSLLKQVLTTWREDLEDDYHDCQDAMRQQEYLRRIEVLKTLGVALTEPKECEQCEDYATDLARVEDEYEDLREDLSRSQQDCERLTKVLETISREALSI